MLLAGTLIPMALNCIFHRIAFPSFSCTLWVEVISVLLGTVRPFIVSVLKCTVMVLAPANGTMRMVVLRVVFGLNAAVLFVLAATTLVEGPIFHDVEFPLALHIHPCNW